MRKDCCVNRKGYVHQKFKPPIAEAIITILVYGKLVVGPTYIKSKVFCFKFCLIWLSEGMANVKTGG